MECLPIVQDDFPPDYKSVRDMLRTKIQTCNAVVHLAGFYYGAEPQPVLPGPDRRSFTQMEYEIAVELKLPCYVFLCGRDFPFDPHDPEPEDKQQLQLDHRERLLKRDELFYEFASPEELANRTRELQLSVEGLREELAKERNRRRLAMVAAVAALLIAVVGGIWMYGRQKQQEAVNVAQTSEIASLKEQLEGPWSIVNKVNSATELMREQGNGTEEEIQTVAIAMVATELKKTPEEIKQAIDSATQLSQQLIAAARAEGEKDASKRDENLLLEAQTYMKLAASHEASANFGEAILAYNKALELLNPETHPEPWLDALCSSAEMEDELGNDAASGEKYRKAMEFGNSNPALGPAHRLTIFASARFVSYLTYSEKDLPAAEKLLRKIVKTRTELLGPESPDTLRAMGDLSEVLAAEEKYAEAADLNIEALEISEKVFGEDGKVTMDIVDNLASVFRAMNELDDAIKLKRRVIEFREKTLGPDDRVTLAGTLVLAGMLKQVGDLPEAKKLVSRVCESNEKNLGAEHPLTLSSMETYAGVLSKAEDFEGAEKIYRTVLEVRERVQGSDHPDTIDTVGSLASIRWAQDDLPGAEKFYRRILTVREDRSGADHPDTIETVNDIAVLLSLQEEFGAAEPLFRRVLEAREESLKDSDPDLAQSYFQLAKVLNDLNQKEEGLKYAKKAAKLAVEFLPEDDEDRLRYEELVVTLEEPDTVSPGASNSGDATE